MTQTPAADIVEQARMWVGQWEAAGAQTVARQLNTLAAEIEALRAREAELQAVFIRLLDACDRYNGIFSHVKPGLAAQHQGKMTLAVQHAYRVLGIGRTEAQHDREAELQRKLDEAVKALEPFALISSEGVIGSRATKGHVEITTCAEHFHDAADALASIRGEG